MVFLVNAQEHTSRKLYCTDEDRAISIGIVLRWNLRSRYPRRANDPYRPFLRGTPYVASTLEKRSRRALVVNLRELDCTTFAETVLALSRTCGKKSYL